MTSTDIARRIIDRVEEIAAKGIAGDAVRQVPEGYDYGRHWPIMVAIEMLSTPPADDVREALATNWLTSYHGSIDATALTLAFKAGYAAAEVRPRGTVTDAEMDRVQEAAGERGVFMQDWQVRVILEEARRA